MDLSRPLHLVIVTIQARDDIDRSNLCPVLVLIKGTYVTNYSAVKVRVPRIVYRMYAFDCSRSSIALLGCHACEHPE